MQSNKRIQYRIEDKEKAIEDIKMNKLSLRKASMLYKIPRTTLADTIKQKYNKSGLMGAPTVLSSSEELILVKWVIEMGELGFPVTTTQLLDTVSKLVVNLKRENPFKNNIPGKKWLAGFLNRHPDLSKRVSQSLTPSRAAISEQNIRGWFSRVKSYMNERQIMNILDDPRRVFNCDETAFYLSPKEKQCLARKGSKKVYNRVANDEKECLTVLLTINADGDVPPPLILFPYKRYVPAHIASQVPKQWGLGFSESGWMTSETFYEYVTNVFFQWVKKQNIPLPIILFVDGHSSHINLSITEFCKENGIILTALYPNATHIIQPLDVGVFSPLKNSWRKNVRTWRMDNGGQKLQRNDFPRILEKTLNSTLSPEIIRNGFKACGIYPFDENRIDYTKLLKNTESFNDIMNFDSGENVSTGSGSSNGALSDEQLLCAVEKRMCHTILEKFKKTVTVDDLEERYHELYKFWMNIHSPVVLNNTDIIPENNVSIDNQNDSISIVSNSEIVFDEFSWAEIAGSEIFL